MGIFDEATRELAEEEARRDEEETRLQKECDKALNEFKSELQNHMARERGFGSYEVIATDSGIGLTVDDKMLIIGCIGADKFFVTDKAEGSTAKGRPVSAKDAAKKALVWLKSLT